MRGWRRPRRSERRDKLEPRLRERVATLGRTAISAGSVKEIHSHLSDGSRGRIALVEELAVANTPGDTLDEARENLNEALELVLELNRVLAEESHLGTGVIREPCRQQNGQYKCARHSASS